MGMTRENMARMLVELTSKKPGGETPEFVLINNFESATLFGIRCSSPWQFRIKMREYGLSPLQIQRQLISWRDNRPERRWMNCGIWIRKRQKKYLAPPTASSRSL
jgi:hypothetical protein